MIESRLDPDLANQNIPSLFRMENRTPHSKSALESGNLAWEVGQWVKCRCRSVRTRVQSPAHTRVQGTLPYAYSSSSGKVEIGDPCGWLVTSPNLICKLQVPMQGLISETKWTTPEESYQRLTSGLYLPCTCVHMHVPMHIQELKFLSHSWRLRTMR